MKLTFKLDTLPRYSFKDLDYGLTVLIQKRDVLRIKCFEHIREISKRSGSISYGPMEKIRKDYIETVNKLEEKIALVEDEMSNRMLTGQDDGVFENLFLGEENV